jgi:hypothetical protein
MPLHFFVSRLISTRALYAVLLVAAFAVTTAPASAQWDRDGYFTGGDEERDEPRRTRRPREPRTPSDSYDFGVDQRGDKASGIADVSYFYETLDDGGVWMNHPRYGDVWQPYVDESWRPYTLGRWAYSDDYGWTWVSDEPFGWAVYHYGRWSYDGDYGWLWVPGTEWAPAWVTWRQSDEAIGWAPLPPEARLRNGQNFDDTEFAHTERFNRTWVFVRPRYFARPEMRRYVRPSSWNNDLVHSTAPRNNFERRTKHMGNRGLAPDEVERLSNRPVPRIRVAPVDDPGLRRPGRFDNWRARSNGDVKLFRPERQRTEEAVRKFRKNQSDDANKESGSAGAVVPRAPRRASKPVPPGMHPGGKPSVAAARPPRFERGPESKPPEVQPSDVTRDAETPPAPAPAATPPASAAKPAQPVIINPSSPPSASPTADGPVTGPNGKPRRIWRNPDQGAGATAEGTQRDNSGANDDAPARDAAGGATGKRRWDGSGPSGAPSTSAPPVEN